MTESFDVNWEYENNGGELVFVNATGTILRGSPGSFYDRNGDPGDAPEGDEVEFSTISCEDENGNAVEFNSAHEYDLIDYTLDQY